MWLDVYVDDVWMTAVDAVLSAWNDGMWMKQVDCVYTWMMVNVDV